MNEWSAKWQSLESLGSFLSSLKSMISRTMSSGSGFDTSDFKQKRYGSLERPLPLLAFFRRLRNFLTGSSKKCPILHSGKKF
jgi:hypothetical protein